MNKLVIVVVVFAVFLTAGYFWVKTKKTRRPTVSNQVATQNENNSESIQETKENIKVSIRNYDYSPKVVSVKVGESITWINEDPVAHTATGDANEFDTGLLSKGQNKTITFNKVGTFAYHCTPHPNMKATVIVE